MMISRTVAVAAGLALASAAVLSGCSSTPTPSPTDSVIGGDVLPPIIESVNDLQGATVELPLNTVLSIDTESLAVDSYTAEVADPAVVEFVQGRDDGSATFNPGFTPLEEGTTEVTLTNAQGGIQPLTFTIEVVAG